MKRVLAALCAAVASCGIPTDEAAVVITSVPYDLLATTSSTATSLPETEGTFDLRLYFVSLADDSIVQVPRPQNAPPTLEEALNSLVGGPTEDEVALLQVRNAPGVSDLLAPVTSGPISGLLTITVSDEAGFRDRDNNINATGALVCTLTEFEGVESIEIRDSADAIPLSGANAESIGVTARRNDFNDCPEPIDPLTDQASEDSEESPEEEEPES